MKNASRYIEEVIDTAINLLKLADSGDLAREDDGCGVLFATVRDCAYSMKNRAEYEKQRHIEKREWA